MKKVKVEVLTQVITTYREVIEVEVEDGEAAVDKGFEAYLDGLLEGGEEIDFHSELYEVRVCDEAIVEDRG